ncbi:MAG TPA: regulatory protein RecX [Gemmatimonadaceae bacterium]|jgi:regulatory protein|nr:regulatory protein RecX [Gemmatimonadaceae bacterium]
MHTITGIVASARRQGRFDIVVDDRPAATIGLDAIERLGLHVGRVLSAADSASLEREAQALRTVDRALDMLALSARSTRELRRQLIRKGEPEELVAIALERLARLGVLDDAAYARQLARSRIAGSGISRRRLQAELFRKGVDRVIAEEAIATVIDEESVDESANLERVAAKKARTLAKLDPETRRRRLYAFLARRGYESSDITRVMDRLARGESKEDSPSE